MVNGQPRVWLRLEGACTLAATLTAYGAGGHSWVLFAVLFFMPDVTFLSYLGGPRLGALFYNAVHNYAVPIAAALTLYSLGHPVAVPLVWAAHIGFDRTMGYGLKYPGGFVYTHLGLLGNGRRSANMA